MRDISRELGIFRDRGRALGFEVIKVLDQPAILSDIVHYPYPRKESRSRVDHWTHGGTREVISTAETI